VQDGEDAAPFENEPGWQLTITEESQYFPAGQMKETSEALLESSIPPESAPADAIGSALVRIVIPVEFPAVAEPMVKPVRVTCTAALASILRFAMVMMTDLPSEIDGMPNEDGPLGDTQPAATTAVKKYKGNVSVMVLPMSSLPPAEVMKENVAVEFFLPANRSEITIVNEAFAT
jgi:hypothetical protein